MSTEVQPSEPTLEVKRYEIQYPASRYTFPRESQIERVRFDDEHVHLDLLDTVRKLVAHTGHGEGRQSD